MDERICVLQFPRPALYAILLAAFGCQLQPVFAHVVGAVLPAAPHPMITTTPSTRGTTIGGGPFGGGSAPLGGGSFPTGGGSAAFGGGSAAFGGGSAPFGGGSAAFGGGPIPSNGTGTSNTAAVNNLAASMLTNSNQTGLTTANATLTANASTLGSNTLTNTAAVNLLNSGLLGIGLRGGFAFVGGGGYGYGYGGYAQPFMAPVGNTVGPYGYGTYVPDSSFTTIQNLNPYAFPQALARATIFQNGTPMMITAPLVEQYRWPGRQLAVHRSHMLARLHLKAQQKSEKKKK